MPDAARMLDLCKHPGTVVLTGSFDTTTGGKLQARLGDLTSPCPVCCTIPPGRIVQGSKTVFVNKLPAARVDDKIICGIGIPPIPPPPGFHLPASSYSVRSEDNYVEAVFTDDSALIEDSPSPEAKDELPEKEPLKKFLSGLSLDLNLGMRFALKAMLAGPNSVAMGCFSVKIGG
jgi:uncharacterized Zn-binding protein involved in type VI secretion